MSFSTSPSVLAFCLSFCFCQILMFAKNLKIVFEFFCVFSDTVFEFHCTLSSSSNGTARTWITFPCLVFISSIGDLQINSFVTLYTPFAVLCVISISKSLPDGILYLAIKTTLSLHRGCQILIILPPNPPLFLYSTDFFAFPLFDLMPPIAPALRASSGCN